MLPPKAFIGALERFHLINKLDEYIVGQACAHQAAVLAAGKQAVPVSVNVSRIDILDPELETKLMRLLEENGLSPEEYMLEVTESAYCENMERLIEVIENLRKKGFRIEMDDFGSGYSSLNMITTLPIDILKIDMSFVRNMEKDERNLKLVELVAGVAKFLKIPAVAEGVETQSQLDTLKGMGCQIIQGYFFSKPVPPKDFVPFIENELERRRGA